MPCSRHWKNSTLWYIYAGKSLGGRPKDPACYKQHAISSKPGDTLNEVDYPEVMKRPWFLNGIQQLLETASMHTTSILCSEEDPAKCHRHHLIASHLMTTHPEVKILHIRGDSNLVDAKSILNSPISQTQSNCPFESDAYPWIVRWEVYLSFH